MSAENLHGCIPRMETHGVVRMVKEKAGRYRIVGSVCPDCGEKWFPHRFTCPKCHCRKLEEYQCAQTGEVTVSWVDTMGFPVIGCEDIDSRVVAMVKLDDGINIITEIVETDEEVPAGTRVEMVIRALKRDDTGNLVYGYKFKITE